MKSFEYGESDGTLAKRSINGNTYIVAHYRNIQHGMNNELVLVFACPKTGEDQGFPSHPAEISSRDYDYEEIVRSKIYSYTKESTGTIISESINKAVCKVENKQEKEREYEDAIEAAIQANQEVHGSIDDRLN